MINTLEFKQNRHFLNRQSSVEQLHFIPGIWVDGRYFWLPNQMEKVLYGDGLILKVLKKQIHTKISFNQLIISNHGSHEKNIKILAMHHFQNVNKDCLTFISPTDQRIFHHGGQNVFLVNLQHHKEDIKEYTTIPLWNAFTDQIWSSLQKGHLKYQPMAKGPAASILAVNIKVNPQKTEKISTWSISGKNKNDLIAMEQALLKNSLAFPVEK
ncbi:hypothetical protein [Neobacillus mesonae]|uniref:hypothetical protein n=1 Tax=Neobacillus mesonae TaxID=1193713 RepID=UPI00203E8B25|nr:hypothetical protein [Neobacillus mesonae]MCM3566612.1 hypothetical protein [Neobacillus mesonae]